MVHVTRRYAEEDFSHRVMHVPKDGLGELADTLNKMAQHIEDKMKCLEIQNRRLTTIFSSMTEGVVVIDSSGHIVSINPAVERMFGISEDKATGRLFLEVIRNNEMWEVAGEALRSGEPASKEVDLIYPVRGTLQANAAPIFDGYKVSGCLVVIHDITEVKKLEAIRSDFVANVSHELRTPLTSIKGFVETLLDGALDDEEHAASFLNIVRDHAIRLENLIDDLLSLAHLESKEIALDKIEFDLKGRVEEIVLGFTSQLKRKGIAVKNELPSGLRISADKDRIDQVVTNLVDNAIKFNRDKGSIKISAQVFDGETKVIIEDTGVGIREKDMPRIFERFYRVDKARSRQLGGTGLGLSIVKHIVELHGGEVGLESTEGLGSKFWFTLPQ
jgi:two-component system phosphate regulon sensor histidine kinase PhoR